VRSCGACGVTVVEDGHFCPDCGSPFPSASEIGLASTRTGAGVALTAHLQANSASTNLVGATIDSFAIDGIIGGGAFGTVYSGRQLGLGRKIAFKVPTLEMAGDAVTARRFAREARSAARVDHPGVVTIYAVGELPDGRPYLAMQLVDGQPLDAIFAEDGRSEAAARDPIDPVRALKIARSIASALAETHAANVVHRDLKPSNIMWRRDRAGDDRVVLVDFGIAVCKPGGADATRLTGGNLIGTPHYMSPEQAHGDDVDGRADLYALGCILFELLTGRTPFDGSGFEVLLAHMSRPTPAPSTFVPSIPPQIDELLAKLLAKKPDQRAQTGDEVVALIDETLASLAPVPEVVVPRTRRSLARVLAIGLVAIGALSAVGFAAVKLSHRAPAEVADGSNEVRKELTLDDGTFITKVSIPDPIRAKVDARVRIRVLTKLGKLLAVEQLVVTVQDANGATTGFTARRRARDGQEFFSFRHVFPAPGKYVMRIFPPESDSEFLVDLVVN